MEVLIGNSTINGRFSIATFDYRRYSSSMYLQMQCSILTFPIESAFWTSAWGEGQLLIFRHPWPRAWQRYGYLIYANLSCGFKFQPILKITSGSRIYNWLVGWTPLKNISQLGWWKFPIYGKIKNVPNHQPVNVVYNLGKPRFLVDRPGLTSYPPSPAHRFDFSLRTVGYRSKLATQKIRY